MITTENFLREQIVETLDRFGESTKPEKIARYIGFLEYEVRGELNRMYMEGLADEDNGYWYLVQK